jgi:LPS sulfotransferase NodH
MRPRGYVICTTPRSGSNYLCQLLASTGALGRPLEYFDAPAVRKAGIADYPDDPEAQLDLIPRLGGSPNGVYGLKVFPYQFERVAALGWTERLPGELQFVFLTRRDLLGQAMSLVRANQTQAWTAGEALTGEADYAPAAIEAAMTEITLGVGRWERWFARNGLWPLRLEYGDLSQGGTPTEGALSNIAKLVGVPGAVADTQLVDLQRQRDQLSDLWRKAFLAPGDGRGDF